MKIVNLDNPAPVNYVFTFHDDKSRAEFVRSLSVDSNHSIEGRKVVIAKGGMLERYLTSPHVYSVEAVYVTLNLKGHDKQSMMRALLNLIALEEEMRREFHPETYSEYILGPTGNMTFHSVKIR